MATTVTFDSIDQFLKSLTARGRAENTVRARGADLREFLKWAGDHPAEEYESLAQDYLNEVRKTKAPKTVQRYLSSLRLFAKHIGQPGALHDYLAPKAGRAIPHPLPEGKVGIDVMLNLATTREQRCLVGLTGMAGLRVHEAVSVRVDDVNVIERTITVRGKGDRTRTIPVSDRLMGVLADTIANPGPNRRFVPVHERTARRIITRLGERAGLMRGVASHDMRATFATEAYKATKDLRAVQELLGHADSRTTEVYTGISMDAMRRAADAASGSDEDAS